MKRLLIFLSFIIPTVLVAQTTLDIPYSVRVKTARPTDAYYYNLSFAPYTSTSQVLSEVTSGSRYKGQRFRVGNIEYVFDTGILDSDLVIYVPGIPSQTGNSGNYLTTDGTSLSWSAVSGGGSTTFTGLTDSPGPYSGKGLNFIRVNTGETALEYQTPSQVRADLGITLPSGAIVGTSDTQTLTNKTLTSPVLTTPDLGTPSNLNLSNANSLNLTSGVVAILPVANGGTGTATPGIVAGTNVTVTGTWPNQTVNSTASGGVADPGSNGIMKRTALNTTTAAVAGTDYIAPYSAQNTNLAFLTPLPGLSNANTATPAFRTLDNTDLPYSNQQKVFISALTAYAFGDSFTNSQQATSTAYGYINIFGAKNFINISNQSASGRGAFAAAQNAVTNIPQNSNFEATCLFGFNDVRRNGSASATLNKINAAIGVVAVTSWLQSYVGANSVTNTGSWSNYTTITSRSGQARQSSTSGNTLSYTTTTVSTNIVIGCFGSDGTTADYGRFTITIDGVSFGTYTSNGVTDAISDGTASNAIINNVVVIDGLAASTHAVTLTLLDNKVTPIDYIGYMRAPADCQGILVASIPRMNAAGYAISPSSANDAVIDAAKVSMRNYVSSLSQYGRNIVFIDVDKWYDPTIHVGADFIHPNDLGYRALANAFQSGVASSGNIKSEFVTVRANNQNSYNPGYLTEYSNGSTLDIMQLSINRNPNTGVISNVGKASAAIAISSSSADGNIVMYTSPTNNTSPAEVMRIDKSGNTLIGSASSNAKLYVNSPIYSSTTALPSFRIDGANHTNLTANTEYTNVWYNFSSNTIQFAGGSFALQRTFRYGAPTYSATSPTSLTDLVGVEYEQPIAGTNMVVSRTWAATYKGNLAATGSVYIGSSFVTPNSSLHVNGSASFGYVAKTANYTLTSTDYTVEVTTGTNTQTLPTAVGITGREYTITNSGSGVVTIATTSSQTFANVIGTPTSLTLSQGQTDIYQSNGANWLRVSSTSGDNVRGIQSTYTNYTTTLTYQNVASITLTPGDWDISALYTLSANSATLTATSNAIFAISTTTASAAGSVEGESIAYISQSILGSTGSKISDAISPYRVSITSNTTYYLNTQTDFTLGNPQFVGSIRAVKVK